VLHRAARIRRRVATSSSRRTPGPICGRPPWHKRFLRSDRIACIHMSGLLVRSLWTAGQDGFRNTSSNQPRDLCSANGSHGFARILDRSILPSTPLAAPVRSVGEPASWPNLSTTRRQRFGHRSAHDRNSLLSSSASRRCGRSCWPAPRQPASASCA
jgi:hypothetical protein